MAEPTTAKTAGDLIIRISELAGIGYYGAAGDGVAQVPNDSHDLDLCYRILNDAISMFISDGPITGWRWMRRTMEVTFAPAFTGTATAGATTTLTDGAIAGTYDNDYFNTFLLKITSGIGLDETATVTDYDGTLGKFTFTALSGGSTPDTTSGYTISRSTTVVGADPGRYTLAENFGGSPEGRISYAKNTNIGTPIKWVSEATIRQLRETSTPTGYPYLAAILPSETERRYDILFYPDPSTAIVVEFPYTLFFDKLTVTTDVHPAGFMFDDVILLACKAQAEMGIEDINAGWAEMYHKKGIPQAYKIDARSAPRRLGSLNVGRERPERVWSDVTTEHDV